MVAEAKRPPSEVWTQAEGQVVNGTFPLHRCLGSSDHSGVFLTEYAAQNLPRAALKLVPAIPTLAESQLSHWRAAAAVAHPRLIRLFETGRCQLAGQHYLYVVMDYADQNLGQLLLHRPLTQDEAREMLPPTLDALAFLHSRDLVQGQLKPSNILVIDNQLKLASDTIRPAGEATASIGTLSVYNPPEARDGSFSTSGDIWALGVTLCQALTQRPPTRSGERGESVGLPTDFPVTFIDVVRRCLARNPAQRPGAADLQAWIDPASTERGAAAAPPVVVTTPSDIETPTRPDIEPLPARKSVLLPTVGVLAVLVICWAAVQWFSSHSNSKAPTVAPATIAVQPTGPQSTASSAQTATETPPGPAPATSGLAPPVALPANGHSPRPRSARANVEPGSSSGVLHEEIPTVPERARQTIHGHVKVTVRVTTDKSGNVISDVVENPGPSKYFARLAGDAAGKWKFVPANSPAPRQWLVRFEFSRDGTKAHAALRN